MTAEDGSRRTMEKNNKKDEKKGENLSVFSIDFSPLFFYPIWSEGRGANEGEKVSRAEDCFLAGQLSVFAFCRPGSDLWDSGADIGARILDLHRAGCLYPVSPRFCRALSGMVFVCRAWTCDLAFPGPGDFCSHHAAPMLGDGSGTAFIHAVSQRAAPPPPECGGGRLRMGGGACDLRKRYQYQLLPQPPCAQSAGGVRRTVPLPAAGRTA